MRLAAEEMYMGARTSEYTFSGDTGDPGDTGDTGAGETGEGETVDTGDTGGTGETGAGETGVSGSRLSNPAFPGVPVRTPRRAEGKTEHLI